MQRRFHVPTNQATTATTYKSVGLLTSAATIRPAIYEFNLGTEGAPAENAMVYLLQRATTTTTFTAVTPVPIDPTDGVLTNPVALASAGSNATVEPTYTAAQKLWGDMGFNQRATYRWVAAPGGEILIPAVAANGAGMQVKSAGYTGQTDCIFYHQE
jgi:hypothetical protein